MLQTGPNLSSLALSKRFTKTSHRCCIESLTLRCDVVSWEIMHRVARAMQFLWHAIYNGLGDGQIKPDLSQAVTTPKFGKISKYGPPILLAGSCWIFVLGYFVLECNKTISDNQSEATWLRSIINYILTAITQTENWHRGLELDRHRWRSRLCSRWGTSFLLSAIANFQDKFINRLDSVVELSSTDCESCRIFFTMIAHCTRKAMIYLV